MNKNLMNKYFMETFDKLYFLIHAEKIHPHQEFDVSHFGDLVKQEYFENPDIFYFKPNRMPGFSTNKIGKICNVDIFDMRFPSPVHTQYEENNTAYGYYFKASKRRDTISIILLHGWGRKSLRAEKKFALKLAREGIHCFMMKLPFHFERAPGGMWSGKYILTGDVLRTVEVMRQHVIEVRMVSSWLREQGGKVGIVGMSLGGMMAQLAMAVEAFDVGVTILAGGNNAGIIWEGISTRAVKEGLVNIGIDREQTSKIFRIINPTIMAKHNKTKNLFMINGLYDKVIPVKYTIELWEALGRPRIKWYPCAHVSVVFFMRSIIRDVIQFIRETTVETSRQDVSARVSLIPQ
jgi:dienelactone hydrolase